MIKLSYVLPVVGSYPLGMCQKISHRWPQGPEVKIVQYSKKVNNLKFILKAYKVQLEIPLQTDR